MPSLRIPLVGSLTNRNVAATSAQTTDQQFTNCFPEVTENSVTGKQEIVLNKRHGFTTTAAVQSGATGSYGVVVWTTSSTSPSKPALSFRKSGATSTMVFASDTSQIGGDIPATVDCLFLAETSVNATGHLTGAFTDAATGAIEHWYYPEGGAWTQITSGNFPSPVTAAHAHMDGYEFAMAKSGKLHNSDLNSLANWTAGNYISLNSGGKGLGCLRHKNFIIGFSDYAMEFFRNNGNAFGSVLSRVDEGVVKIGVLGTDVAAPPMKSIGDSIYVIGRNADNGTKAVWRVGGDFKFDKISNAGVDRLVANAQMQSILGSFSMSGKTHIAFSGTSQIVCYCLEMKTWWFLRTGILGQAGAPLEIRGIVGWDNTGSVEVAMNAVDNAMLYKAITATPLWQDATSSYSLAVQTGANSYGTYKKKYFKELSLEGDSQTSTSAVSVSYSDDDFSTFTSAGSIDLNTVPPVKLTRLGSSRKRAWKIAHSANTPCRLKVLELDYDVGKS